ncbi:dethiobiotin synthase [Streptomyces clavuligerus]|uniref:ATP-dependent dethiobiotin synthetase BioD n=1 Tax=Streptomyces clavuligerus TaxID=1901 RepID=E2Q9I9_STRCL|nr:dethiobiotin synthase [Streptomyces clavuligerus]ANW21273.1 dethiobiotin synthase [Streptomyces clavuligerus]AXU15899.1 ATP-dependent dethiobiotin synthetase BioD [Streptomyces clavuligerus]EFG05609.1 Dethiobiotin synthetase [Streptomyces clavuligerus]MBY6306025.1 ATP-dependent dethiobiotin synthetase BioD [Streptomyces clavuligerus]QCS08680.1 ATP-dependent dethiobiotin synthetase BioD [Streptomyces clavuligerus]
MSVIVVSGTGTDIGKTVVTAGLVALAQGRRVAVVKPAQTGVAEGEPGDLAEVVRLGGPAHTLELVRFPEPLAPATAARRAGVPGPGAEEVADRIAALSGAYDLVLVEGAGGLLVRFDAGGSTLADTARLLAAPVLVVASAGLGTLNSVALTGEALRARGVAQLGVVVGSWPAVPGLADRCNLLDLPEAAGAPLLGAVPEGAGRLSPADFRARAADWFAPSLGGRRPTASAPPAPAAAPVRRPVAAAAALR